MPIRSSKHLGSISRDYRDNRNLENATNFFRQNNFALLPNFLDSATANNWATVCKKLLTKYGIHIERGVSGKRLSYTVVTGDTIRRHGFEIYGFYRSSVMRNLIRQVTGAREIYSSQHLRSSININYLYRPDHIYRWHFDAEPYSSLLFLTSLRKEDGGALRIRPLKGQAQNNSSTVEIPKGGGVRTITPEAGSLVIIDGTTCAHSVAPLRRECDRITLAMVYPDSLGRPRPEKLDDYLYDRSITDEKFHGDPNLPRR